MSKIFRAYFVILRLLIIVISFQEIVFAEEAINIQVKTSDGEYYQALKSFESLPKRKRTAESYIAAGRAAWALSLHEKADEYFSNALELNGLSDVDVGRTYLSKAIIAHQMEHHQMAVLLGQKATNYITTPGPLRAKIWLLIGQARISVKEYTQAHADLKNALSESSIEDEGEARFQLGRVSLLLGNYEESANNYKSIPVGHFRTAEAYRDLADCYLRMGEASKAKFWVEKGQTEYPDYFVDSWPKYALVQAAIKDKNFEQMRMLRNDVNRVFPSTDFWVTLINASSEVEEAKIRNNNLMNLNGSVL
jgi:tetratricopeptide (TPR) repeat protein